MENEISSLEIKILRHYYYEKVWVLDSVVALKTFNNLHYYYVLEMYSSLGFSWYKFKWSVRLWWNVVKGNQ